jgi:dTDP-glucose pyrophosphorylase
MAGHGSRFIQAGYELPKMLLDAHGKTLLEWSLNSLPLHLADTVVFIGLAEHENQFQLQNKITELYPNLSCKFAFIEKVTRGQAETVYLTLPLCNTSQPLVIFNIDTFFNSSTLEQNLLKQDVDGVLGCFYSNENRFSYASVDTVFGYVREVREKEVISDHALTGLYTFKSIHDFREAFEYQEKNDLKVKGEFYIAPMYNYLIEKGKKYILDPSDKHYILGTPNEYEAFKKLVDF